MKKAGKLTAILLALALFAPNARAVPYSELNPTDKRDFWLHFSVGYAVNLTGAMLFRKMGLKPGYALLLSSALVAAGAYAKEKYKDKTYSGSDMSGGMAGVGASALTFMVLEF